MTDDGAAARRAAWALCAFTVAISVAQVGILVAGGIPLFARESLDEPFPLVSAATLVGAVVGAAIVDRHPRHRVGWLLSVGQAGAALGLTGQALALAILAGDLPLPAMVGHVAGWLGSLFGATYALTLLGLALLLVPDGSPPSPRWRPIGVLLVGGLAVATTGLLLVPPGSFGPTDAVDPGPVVVALALSGQLAVAAGLAGSVVALVVRLRRAHGEERQQLRWIAAGAAAVVGTVAAVLVDALSRDTGAPQRWYLQQLLYLSYLGFQVATGLAVLRYRLYDIDLIIGRTVRLAVLGVFVTAGYVTAVVVLASAVTGSSSAVWPSLLAYVLVALAFQPVRRRVDRFADRIVYGRRAAPYDNLAALSRQLAAGRLPDSDLLQLAARCGALAVGAGTARATVSVPGDDDRSATWPPDTSPRADATVPVVDHGEIVGTIELGLRPGHALTRAQHRLLDEFAAQAALVFRNLRLTAALHRRAADVAAHRAELEASRRRLLTAADTERERVARSIQREVAVHLDPLPRALADVERKLRGDPAGAQRTLERLQACTTRAIEALRVITAGVLPPLLIRRGLAAAVQAHIDRSAARAAVVTGDAVPERLDPSVESAAYQFVVRGLAATQGATVTIGSDDGRLLLAVRGTPAGRLPDRQQVLDRIQAIGGQLDEADCADGGVDLRAVLPLDPSAQAAASRAGPNADFLM